MANVDNSSNFQSRMADLRKQLEANTEQLRDVATVVEVQGRAQVHDVAKDAQGEAFESSSYGPRSLLPSPHEDEAIALREEVVRLRETMQNSVERVQQVAEQRIREYDIRVTLLEAAHAAAEQDKQDLSRQLNTLKQSFIDMQHEHEAAQSRVAIQARVLEYELSVLQKERETAKISWQFEMEQLRKQQQAKEATLAKQVASLTKQLEASQQAKNLTEVAQCQEVQAVTMLWIAEVAQLEQQLHLLTKLPTTTNSTKSATTQEVTTDNLAPHGLLHQVRQLQDQWVGEASQEFTDTRPKIEQQLNLVESAVEDATRQYQELLVNHTQLEYKCARLMKELKRRKTQSKKDHAKLELEE